MSSELGLWKAAIETADKAMAMDFLDFICNTYIITSPDSSWEYFHQYKQLYSSVSGRYMDTNGSKEGHKASRYIIFFPCLTHSFSSLTQSPTSSSSYSPTLVAVERLTDTGF